MSHKFLIVEDDEKETVIIKEILTKRGIYFKLVSNNNNALHELARDDPNLDNPHGYTGVITDLYFPVSELTDKVQPFGFCLYGFAKGEVGIPCVICTKYNSHSDNGWAELMAYSMGIQDEVFFDKDWGGAVDKLIYRRIINLSSFIKT